MMSRRIDKRKVRVVLIALLVLQPLVFIGKANAQGTVQVAGPNSQPNQARDARSQLLAPVFRVELTSLPSAPSSIHGPVARFRGPGITIHGDPSTVGPAGLATQSSANVSLLSGFDGLNQIQSCMCVPPDVQVATGPSRVVEMVNTEGEIFTKQGITNQTFSLSTFFRTGADSISDPKVLYDSPSGRWFASVVDITTGNVVLGVSSTNDPAQTWVFYSISAGGLLPDQPILGISDDKIAVATNDFSGNTFAGSQFWILNKNQLLAGVNTNFFTSGANNGVFSVHPVQSLSSTTTQFMISEIVSRRSLSTASLRFFSVTGVPGVSTVSVVTNDLAVSTIGTSGGGVPGGVQPGTSATVDTNDIRIEDAVWYKGSAWLALNDACTPTGDTQVRSCVRLTKISTTGSPVVSQQFDFGTNGQYDFYPAISIDQAGNLLMVYGYSSAFVFPSLAFTGQLATDPAGSLALSRTLKIGNVADTSTRYGDYFGAALDPTDPSIVWIAGEYHNQSTGSCQNFGSCWTTFIGSASMTGYIVSASPSSLRLSAASGASSNLTLTSVNGFAGIVSITSSKPKGVTVSMAQQVSLTSGGTTSIKLSFTVSGILSPGNYSVIVTASNGTLSRATNLVLTVFPDYILSFQCSCNSLTVLPGTQLQENLTLTRVNGFTGVVGLNTSASPLVTGGPTSSLSQSNQTLSQGGSAIATLLVSSGNVSGTFIITVSASCLSGDCAAPIQQHSIDLSLTVVLSVSSFGGGGGGGRDMRF